MVERLLITGGTGFFGRALLRHFHSEATSSASRQPHHFDEVIVLSRNPEAFANRYPALASAPWLRWVRADVCQYQALDALLIGETVTAVLHAATDSTDAAALSPTDKLYQIVEGTRNILQLAVRLHARRFLLTSSGGVYGPQPAEMEQIPETYCGIPDPLQVSSTYGLGKRMAEHLCQLYAQSYCFETVIARCFAFVGQDLPLDAHFAIGNFIRDALHKPSIEVGGDGTPVRSYMDQRDLSQWLLVLLERGRPGQAYNVGSDAAITIRDLAHVVRDTLALGKLVTVAGGVSAQNFRNRYVPSIAKARTELGLNLEYSLEDSIRESAIIARDGR
jgi:UDP-glucuronate decarboxylase